MMRYDDFNSHVDAVITKMTGMQQIPILHVCDLDKCESKGIIVDRDLSQVYSMDESESENVIVDKSSTEESESESVQKIITTNKEKNTIDETQDEEPSVRDNSVINELRYFNLLECGKKYIEQY